MRYEIKSETLSVVICYLEDGETMITKNESMSLMSPNMKMETVSNGGVGKTIGSMFRGGKDFPEPLCFGTAERRGYRLSGCYG